MADANTAPTIAALQNWPADQQVAVDRLRSLADGGDAVAAAVLAYLLGPQTGRWSEGIRYAEEALADGATSLAYTYGQSLAGQADAEVRSQAERFVRAALDDGWPLDPFGPVLQAMQHGDLGTAERLLNVAIEQRTTAARRQWDDLFTEAASRRQEISDSAVAAKAERDRVAAEMAQDREAIARQRVSVEELAAQVGVLANKTAGGAIAEDYAHRAERVERTARRYTWASILLALLIAVGATAATIVVDSGKLVDDAASKAAIAVPLVALNLYLGRLAAQYRQEAVDLRHIELQFNTANPFLGSLDDEQRKQVLAQLALKFFPGQSLPGGRSGDASNSELHQLAASALLDRLAGALPSPSPRGTPVSSSSGPADASPSAPST